MKLRIKGNSLRLRLTRQEATRLAEEGRVEDEIDFAGRILRYSVRTWTGATHTTALLEPDAIVVVTSPAVATHWAETEQVGFYDEQPTSAGGVLTIAVEKDFRCLDPSRDEDESDHFDNPLAGQPHLATCENPEE